MKHLDKLQITEVPTQLLNTMKGDNKFNNEIDATLDNIHFKSSVNALLSRGIIVRKYTDGNNELFFIGEGFDVKQYTGCATLSK